MFLIFLFILGLAIGSFLNVLIDRLPNEQSINGRSHCDHCKKTLSGFDLIPVISYLFLKGRCRYCKKKLSIQYPFIELLTGISFVFVYFLIAQKIGDIDSSYSLFMVGYLGIISSLIVIFFADVKYHIIPDSTQVSLLFFSVILNVVWHPITRMGILNQVQDDIIAGLITLAPILLIFLITRGRGMGFGDVKLAFIIGFLLGLWPGLMALYIAFIFGAVWGVAMILFKKRGLKSKIAFGPFLVLGILIMLLWGGSIMSMAKNYYPFIN